MNNNRLGLTNVDYTVVSNYPAGYGETYEILNISLYMNTEQINPKFVNINIYFINMAAISQQDLIVR